MIMGVDIETYSSVDLAKAGTRPYTEAPDFTILLIGYKVDDQPTRIIDLTGGAGEAITFLPVTTSDLPAGDLDEFLCLLTDPEVTKTAYNAAFERTCLARYFDRPMPPEQWRCTMVQAATLGLPGTLAQVGAALGLEKQKMEEGKELIRYFCKPTKDGVRHYPADAPEKWELFRRYNIRDVDVETDIRERLSRWPRPQAELDAWALDQRINDRGVRLDMALVDQALKLDAEYSARLKDEAQELTGLPNPKSDSQLKGWLAGRGLVTDSLDKESIPSLLAAAQDETTRRVLAWLAGEKWVLQEFYGDGLIYEATASMMFHVPKDDIKKGGPRADLRSKGKVATLACGYQGSTGALIQMGALKSGIPEDELPGIVRRWRKANQNIVRFWYEVEEAAIGAVQGRPATLDHGIHFECEAGYLFITLPSGRRLAYYRPELKPEPQFEKLGLTYLGTGQNKQWVRQKSYGGKLVENITQATARDCLRDAMTALEAAGYRIVFHVHDEVIADMPKGTGSLDEMKEIMGRPLPWAPGLPLRAAGFEAGFYMKD